MPTIREIGQRLEIQTARLRRYLSYFPQLFSQPGHPVVDHDYTESDVDILRRVRELGDHIVISPPQSSAEEALAGEGKNRGPQEDLPDPNSVTSQLKRVQSKVDAMTTLSQLELAKLSDRFDELSQNQFELAEQLKRVQDVMKAQGAQVTYRRRSSEWTWHWIADCPRYPKEGTFLARTDKPSANTLCRICMGKSDQE